MRAQMFITPVDNVDYETKAIINGSLTTLKEFNWLDDATVYDTIADETKEILIKDISILDHRLILDDVPYHILNMRSFK